MSAVAAGSTGRRWWLYLLECRGGRLYSGISPDPQARIAAHRAGTGARFTRAFPPLRMLGAVELADRSAAARAEHAIKRLPRERKLAFLLSLRTAAADSCSPSHAPPDVA